MQVKHGVGVPEIVALITTGMEKAFAQAEDKEAQEHAHKKPRKN